MNRREGRNDFEPSKKDEVYEMASNSKEEGRGRSPKRARLEFLVLAGLGMIIFLLSGCGSDSTPGHVASGKTEKAAKTDVNMQTVKPLLVPKESGTAPTIPQLSTIPGMPPLEELDAKRKAAARAYEKLDPKSEVLPGLTKKQLEAKFATERARRPDSTQEIFPGLTQGQFYTKLKAHRERPSTPVEIFPGLTEEQSKAEAARARQMQDAKSVHPEQVVPK
jgi:hypothetical protein